MLKDGDAAGVVDTCASGGSKGNKEEAMGEKVVINGRRKAYV